MEENYIIRVTVIGLSSAGRFQLAPVSVYEETVAFETNDYL